MTRLGKTLTSKYAAYSTLFFWLRKRKSLVFHSIEKVEEAQYTHPNGQERKRLQSSTSYYVTMFVPTLQIITRHGILAESFNLSVVELNNLASNRNNLKKENNLLGWQTSPTMMFENQLV